MASKLVVVSGATGRLGRLTVEALLAQPEVRVRALVRDPSASSLAALRGRAEIVAFDAVAAGPADAETAVAGAFAVVSTLQGGPDIIVDAQTRLLEAAKAAGVRRFIPSDFSYNMFTLPPGINVNTDWRRSFAERASAVANPGFDVVHVMQGIFADRAVAGFLGLLDADRGVLRYWGDGATPIDWTTWEDTARFTAAAALDDRPVPSRFYVAGDRRSALEMADRWERGHRRPLVRERQGSLDDLVQETRRRREAEPHNIYAWLPPMYAQGVFGGQALLGPLENARYPDIAAETLTHAIARGAL